MPSWTEKPFYWIVDYFFCELASAASTKGEIFEKFKY